MKRKVLAYSLGFVSSFGTIVILQLLLLFCAPLFVTDFVHPQNSGLIKSCGIFSDFIAAPFMQAAGSLPGMLVLFLLANLLYYQLFLRLFMPRMSGMK